MKARGTVIRWDEARGFGFIRSKEITADVFFHVRDYRPGGGPTPREGLEVAFDVIHVGGKGPRAVAVHLPGSTARAREAPPARRPDRSRPLREALPSRSATILVLVSGYAAVLAWAVWTQLLPRWLVPALAAINFATFVAYWQDKAAAEQGRWRTPEGTLHLWGLAGGWPLGWAAQRVLRHKSSKREFQVTFWCTVLLHLAGLGVLLWWLVQPHA